MEKIGYVYLTTNIVNGKCYVGQHLATEFDTKYKGSGTYIMRAFNKYGWKNFKCEIICWCTTQSQLDACEDNYISLLNTISPNGYNLKGGGANGKLSEEARKNASEAKKGPKNPNYGKHPSEETCKKQSEAQKNRYKNEEERKKTSETQEPYKKKVCQYTKEGEFVRKWESLKEIERVLGYDGSNITRCCKGKQKSAYNFIWRYACNIQQETF